MYGHNTVNKAPPRLNRMFKSERHFTYEHRLNSLDHRSRKNNNNNNDFMSSSNSRMLQKQRSESRGRLPRIESSDFNFIPTYAGTAKATKLRASQFFKLQQSTVGSPTRNSQQEEPLRATASDNKS